MTDNQQQMFAPGTPIVTANGTATDWMLRWMLSIWNRTGGAQPSTGPNTVSAVASQTIAARSFCNLYSDGKRALIRYADPSDLTKYVNCYVLQQTYLNATATAYMPGEWVPGPLNLTPGAAYWLSAPGQIDKVPPTSGGTQLVGWSDKTGSQLFLQPQPIFGI